MNRQGRIFTESEWTAGEIQGVWLRERVRRQTWAVSVRLLHASIQETLCDAERAELEVLGADLPLPVTIRPFHDDDFEKLLTNIEIIASEGRWIGTDAPVDRKRWRDRVHEEICSGGAHLVVEVDDQIVGSGGLKQLIPGLFEIGMALVPQWRGKGIGSALLTEMVEWARRHGAYKITLQVWPHNQSAIALYEKFGFKREGRLRRHWRRRNGELWDVVVMGLALEDEVSE